MSKIKISEEEFNKLSIEEKIKLLKEENVIPPNMSYADLYKLGRPVPSSFDDEGEPKPIDIDRVYSSENADIVKSRNRKGELLNKGINPNVGIYGGDTNLFAQRLKSIQPKKTEAIDDKEKRPWYEEFIPDETTIPALKKGLWEVPKQITADIPQSVAEAYVLDPYGFSMGDLDLETKDPNHKEYKEAYKFIDEYKKTVNPFIGGEEANELLLNYRSDEYPEGFKNSFWGANGLYTEKSVDETKRIMEESIVSKYTQNLSDWYQDRQDRYGDVSDKWINQLVQTVPQFATQLVVATAAGPGAATAYMSSLMYSDTYQNARPYIKEGELTAMEAHRLSSIVGLVSLATNYGPNYLYSSYKNPTLFKDILFNKMKQKGLYKPYSKEAFKGFLSEGLQESIDEITSLTAEGTYRDISNDEWWDRVLTSGSIGMVLGGGASTTLTYVNNQNIKNEVIPKIVETQNLLLPNIMSTDADGNFTFEVKEEDYSSKEEFDKVKEIVDNPEFKEKLDPFKIAERNKKIEDETGEEIPLNMMIFEELNKNNPNTDDVKIKFNQEIPVSIMSDQELLDKNYDPEDFRVSEIKKGEPEYEEGKRQFKVATLGSNIYNSSGGNIILSEGANQDVYIEEVVETLYKKLTTTNPKLKSEIDKWIKSMGKLLNDNNIGGPRGIELFSKWYTFNYLGYSNTEVFLKDIVALPDNIVKEFDTIMGQQKDGTNVSFLFKGGEPIVTETKTNVEEPSEIIETPDESFKIVPQPKDAKIQETPIRTYRLEPTNLKKLYHTTLSRNAGKILKEGLFPLQTTLWKTPDGERHGNGEIYVFESLEDAKAWKLKMQLELTENFGGFEVEPSVTIFEIDNKTDMWEEDIDVASGIPKNILGPNSGRWFRRFEKVPPEDIKVLKDDVSFRLTHQQEEFFKDSKIREPNGELTEVFHGTAAEDFEEFDPSAERGEWKVLGDGTYFSRLPQQANNYTRYGDGNPRVIPAYLNLKNPFIIEGQGLRREIDTPTEPTTEEINRFKEEQIKHSGKDLGYWYDNWLRLPNDIKREVLLDLGYDGVMDGSVYVAFKPEQIKSQFNPKPTSDPRISYRLTPQKLSKIDDFLMEVTMEGESARFWYEKSGQALLDIVDNDYDKARKLLAIIAITSPQMKVKGNFGQMIKANYKYVQGMEPEAGRFPKAMAKRIKDVMEGKDFGGIKTNSFLDNLLVQLEEHKRSTDDKPVTVDLWMMRAFGFDKDVPTELEYKQIREAIQKIAKKIGWEPHQVQASIWTSVQARWNLIYNQEKDKSIKAGTLKKVGKKYVWKNKKAESNFRKKIFKLLKTTSLSKQIIEDNNFDYSDALNSFKGVVRTETFPHPSTKIFEGLNPTFEQQLEYDFDIRQLLTDKNGKDKIAKLIGLLEVGKFNAPGFYEGDISPSQQLEVLMSTSDVSINPETKTLLELYASIYGILTKQQAVGITKVFNPKSKKQANVVMVETKGDIPFEQIYKALLDAGYDTGAIPQNYGFNVVNFNKSVDNKKFQNDVESIINKVYENSSETINFELGQSDGLDIDNNWEENPNGESYKQRISKSEQQDVIEQFISSTSDEISKINEDYKQKWSEKTYRLAPQDPDQLTPEMAEELDKQEQLQRDEETLNNTLSNIELNEPSITDKTKDKIESLKKLNAINTIEKFLTPISTLLENIHPKLKRVLREFEFNLMSKSHKRRRIVKDFYDKAKKMSKVDFNKLDILFKNSSMETSQNEINKLLKKYNLQSEYKAIRDMLDEIRQEAIDSGMDIGFLENYIPRIVKNLDKLRTDVFGLDPELQTTYNKLVEEVRKELGRDLKQEEKEHIVDLILRGYRSLDSGKPNPTKQRKVTVVTNEMNKHYVHSSEALMRHIEAMTTDIETRNLLGKNENTTDNINNYIVEIIEDVGLSDEQILQVKEILIARLNPSVTSPLTGLIRNTTYILTMGSYTSALTQVGDLTWALYEGGIFETTRSVLTHFSKNNTKMEEIYFDRIGQEYEEGNFGADAVNTVFKFSGLNRMDRLGKEALINSLLQRFHKDAKKLMEGKDSEKLVADIEAYFDTDDIAKIKKLIEDLAAGILSEDVKLLIFNKVLDYQPMARSEMPLKYIEGDTSRLFFQLKTFSLRQLDVFRKKLITNVKKAKGPKAKAKALYEFSKLLTMFLMAGVSKDVLKDLAMGRDIDDLEDYVKENLFQLVLFSRYQYYKVKEEGALGVAERFIAPPAVSATFRFAKAFYDFITPRELTEKESKLSPYEIRKIREEEREKDLSNLVKWIPILGKHFHWRSDTGRKKDLNVQMKELERKIKKLKIDGKILNKKDRKEYLRVIRDAKDIDMITPAQWENKVDAAYGD